MKKLEDSEVPRLLKELDVAPDFALLTEEHVAAGRGVSLSLVRQERASGCGVPIIRQGRRVSYLKSDLIEYIKGLRRGVPEAQPAISEEHA